MPMRRRCAAGNGYIGTIDLGSLALSKARRTDLVSTLNSSLFGALSSIGKEINRRDPGGIWFHQWETMAWAYYLLPWVIQPGTREYELAGIVLPGQGHQYSGSSTDY